MDKNKSTETTQPNFEDLQFYVAKTKTKFVSLKTNIKEIQKQIHKLQSEIEKL